VRTVAENRPNTIISVGPRRVLVETETGHRNHVSLQELQALADRVYGGEEVIVPLRGRSAFHMAILATLNDVDVGLNPRRVWLKDPPEAFDLEYEQLFADAGPMVAREGLVAYRRHRVLERSPVLCRMKKEAVLRSAGRLSCEVCGFDFSERYGPLGDGFIECHHTTGLADGGERETTTADLAVVCANCHRMIHRSTPMLSIEQLRDRLRAGR
jgi:hypothetical protein